MATKTITLGIEYSQLTKAVNDSNAQLARLDSEFKRVNSTINDGSTVADKTANKMGYLSDRVEMQQQKVDALRAKYEMLKNAHADTSQIDRAYTAWSNAQTTLNEYQRDLDSCGMSQQQLMGIMAASIATIGAVASAWTDCAVSVANYVDDVQTMAQKSGASVETVQVWQTMADTVDVSAETMSGAMAKLTKNMDSAKSGSGNAADAFKQLGVKVTDSSGNLRRAEEVMFEVFDALSQMTNETEKDATAMAIFGKSANDMAGYIDMGSAGFEQLTAHAKELGTILSTEEIEASSQFNAALEDMDAKIEGVKNRIGASFAPILTALVNIFNEIPQPVLTVGAAITSLVVVLVAGAVGLAAFNASLNMIGPAAMSAAAGLAPLMAEFLPLIAILGLVVVAIASMVSAVNDIKDMGGITGTFDKIILVMKDMISKSDLLSEAVERIGGVFKAIGKFIDSIKQKIHDVAQALANFWEVVKGGNSAVQEGMGSVGGNSIGRNASGTDNWRGGLTWVGEQGPELVSLPRGSQIYNNTDSRNMSSYNISISLDLTKMKSVNDVVKAVQGLGITNGGI